MNIVLLITVTFTLALGHEHHEKPCQKTEKTETYKRFVERHIVASFPDSASEWEKYLRDNKLCEGRPKVQFFMEERHKELVKKICEGEGWYQPDPKEKNLCISNDQVDVYEVTKDNTCKVTNITRKLQYVIVACDETKEEGCRPVHYDSSTDVKPDNPDKCQ